MASSFRKSHRDLAAWALVLAPALACADSTSAPPPSTSDAAAAAVDAALPNRDGREAAAGAAPLWDLDRDGVPPVVTADYIESSKIAEVSLFRSSMGHDYWDSLERCRSMKHYFVPRSNALAGTIEIRAPFDAEVERVDPEWAGVQLHLRSRHQPAFTAILFHVVLNPPLQPGQPLDAGQLLGLHVGPQTSSDVALAVATPGGRRLISYFEAMADPVWQAYAQRGLETRRALIITREERDADPLMCEGERFVTAGTLPQRRELR